MSQEFTPTGQTLWTPDTAPVAPADVAAFKAKVIKVDEMRLNEQAAETAAMIRRVFEDNP